MQKMKLHHFLGNSVCETVEELEEALAQSVDGVNEYFIVKEHTMFPYLTVLINGPYAHVYCVPTEEAAGSLAFSEDTETGLDPDAISIFYTNTPTEEIEIYNDYVIPKELAVQVVKDFAENGAMSDRVQWDEL